MDLREFDLLKINLSLGNCPQWMLKTGLRCSNTNSRDWRCPDIATKCSARNFGLQSQLPPHTRANSLRRSLPTALSTGGISRPSLTHRPPARTSAGMTFILPFPQIDPAIFTISLGGFEFVLRWYALAYIAGLIIGWRLVRRLMQRPALWPRDKAPMKPEEPEDLLVWMILGVVLGGRLGYVLFYSQGQFLSDPLSIVRVWEGGMSFHGGFLGVIAGVLLFTYRRHLPLLQVGDAVALGAPVGIFFGRLANFINGELWGRTTDLPWAMVFPGAGPDPRHPSQLYEAGLEGLLLGAVMWWLALRRGWLKRPGRIIGVFFIGYGLGRSLVENVRQWDAHIGYAVEIGSGGLTMGQMLSLPMTLIGLAFVLRARKPEQV